MRKILSLICALLLLFLGTGATPLYAADADETIENALGDILAYEFEQAGVSDQNAWLKKTLPENIGSTAEWYVLALAAEGGYDLTAYAAALTDAIKTKNITNAVAKQKYALALLASGYTSDFVSETAENAVGKLGIMSYVYAVHLGANGFLPKDQTLENLTETLISFALPDGGFAVSGEYANPDVTAMVLQALAHKKDEPAVATAIENALSCLSSMQTENGGFISYGAENAESAAQVLIALSALEMDPKDARFTKNGNTLLDALLSFRCENGGFAHTQGDDANANATVQAYLALSSLKNGSFYCLRGLDALTYIETETLPQNISEDETVPMWRIVSLSVIWSGAVIAALALFLMKKRNYKNFLLIFVLAAVLSALVFMINIESADGYYGSTAEKQYPIGTVTLSIRCDTMTGRTDLSYVPEDGVILAPTAIVLGRGESVFDLLEQAVRENRIHMEYSGSGKTAYIQGIGYLYELANGDLSGWVYQVNGESPSVGCGSYQPKDGDEIVFHYTLEQGKDIG